MQLHHQVNGRGPKAGRNPVQRVRMSDIAANVIDLGQERDKREKIDLDGPEPCIAVPAFEVSDAEMCASCPKPGVCCRDFPLVGGPDSTTQALQTKLEAIVWATQQIYRGPEYADLDVEHVRVFIGLPFLPIDNEAGPFWHWSCINLLPSGRCGDYENRPYGPCVTFRPGDRPGGGAICVRNSKHER